MQENIVAGLISGVMASLIIFLFRSVWKGVVIPWFEERIYKDVKIEGNWFSLYPSTLDSRQEVVTITRHGHSVTGTIVCSAGSDAGERYQITGSFRNMLLPLTYESGDPRKSDRGTITLKSVHNGERLVGKIANYDTISESISTANIIWFRSMIELDKFVADRKKNSEAIKDLYKKSRSIEKQLNVAEGVAEKAVEKDCVDLPFVEEVKDTDSSVKAEVAAAPVTDKTA